MQIGCQIKMASQRTEEIEACIEGLDIIVDGCSPEFEIFKLRHDIDMSVKDSSALRLPLEELICQNSSTVITVNHSRKVSWTWSSVKDSKTNDKVQEVVAAVVSVNVEGHGDGIKFTNEPKLGTSIVEGVKNYIISMRATILKQYSGSNITEIRVMTNIREGDEYLAFKIDPKSGTSKQDNVPWRESAMSTDWKRQMRYAIPVCGTCRSDIIIGQTKIVCGSCSSEFHWTCVEITAVKGRPNAMRMNHWLCSSCSSAQKGDQTAGDTGHQTGTAKRRRKRRKRH